MSSHRILVAALRCAAARRLPGAPSFAVHQALEVAVPVVIGVVIDRAVATGDVASMARWVLACSSLVFACLSAAGCTGLYVEEQAVTGAGHWARMRRGRARPRPRRWRRATPWPARSSACPPSRRPASARASAP